MKGAYLLFFSCLVNISMMAQNEKIPAFPGAEGFGKYTTGGRGGMVYIVTNLNDSGIGSLRWAVEAKGPRTVVFEVSGNISLKSRLDVSDGNLTIAGQTAPGDGITIQNYPMRIMGKDNIIIRFLRFRLGDLANIGQDAFSVRNGSSNLIVDHCSFSWGTDETCSIYDVTDATIQNCIISEGLNYSVHPEGLHGFGALLGGDRFSIFKNIWAHFTIRNPRFTPSGVKGIVDLRNNVIYNWEQKAAEGGGYGSTNIYDNFFKPGPATYSKGGYAPNFFLRPSPVDGNPQSFGKFYLEGNILEGKPEVNHDQWLGVRISSAFDETVFENLKNKNYNGTLEPFEIPNNIYNTSLRAEEAFKKVLSIAGASLKRDEIDERIVREVISGTYTYKGSKTGISGIIDSQTDVGGWPKLNFLPAPKDSDRDGMPDDWEIANGLDPNKADHNGNKLHPQYTNLEVYLNSLVSHIMEVPNEVKIPESPILIGPENLQISPSGKIALKWSKPINAELYRVQVSKDPDFKTKQLDLYNIPTETVSVDIKESGIFYWRVNASNKVGSGEFSASWKFETVELPPPPQLISPIANQENTDAHIHFKWEPSPRADSYRIQVSLFRDFSQRTLDRSNVKQTDFELGNLEEGKTYYWRVRATNLAGNSPYSEIREFHTKKSLAVPSIPQLLSPASSAMVNGKLIHFEWSTAERAEKYEIQVSKFSNFSQTHAYHQKGLTQNYIAVEKLEPDQIFFWRVRAINASGPGPYSAIRNFRTEPLPALNAVTLVSPQDRYISETDKIDFSWGKVEEAENYQLELSKDSTFRDQVLRFSGIQEQRFFLDSLERDSKYFWRVMAQGKRPSSQSKIWSFRVREDLKLVSAHNSTIEISVYPNPFDRILYLEFSKAIKGDLSIRLIDVKGIQVFDISVDQIKEKLSLELPNGLPKGIYILQTQGFGLYQNKKLIKN